MSQNPLDPPDQSAQGGAGSTSGSSSVPPGSPYGTADPTAGSGGSAPSSTSGAAPTDPYGSQSPYGSSGQGPYSAPSPYGAPGSAGSPTPYGQQQGYGQPSDPGYGQAQYPPAGGQQQYGGAAYDPNAGYGAQQQGYPQQQYSQPGYPQQYAGQPGAGAPVTENDEKLWATLAHVSIPFFGFVGPLIVYLIYKDRSQFLKDASTEALNFSILYSIATIISSITVAVLIGLVLWPLVFIGGLILCIMAAIASNKHVLYRYPLNWRLIK